MDMTPLSPQVYCDHCDHGFPIGGDCWQCWQRRALDQDAEIARLKALEESYETALAQAKAEEREADCAAIRAACSMCNGMGGENVPGGYVSRDMALDAGDPALEGQPLPYQSYECEYCGRPIAAIRARMP